MAKPRVGMIGLAVMGSNLAQNIERNGFPCAVFNRNGAVTKEFMVRVKGKNFTPSVTLKGFVDSMDAPRQIFMMVKAGAPVDDLIEQLIPLLSKGDILIDGGNTYFTDTQRREKRCQSAGINFMGIGISGGEKGALEGASLMPGGPKDAWKIMSPVLDKIAAKVDGKACTAYIGPDGAGHFVKMVHNGIEYGDMQLIAEGYHLLRTLGGCGAAELGEIFNTWNEGVLSSYLIEITGKVFRKKDDDGKAYLVDKILDKAGQKGTGKWTSQVALDLGVAIPTLAAAVDARILSALKDERKSVSGVFSEPVVKQVASDKAKLIKDVHDALYCSKIMAYAQGMALLRAASDEQKWELKLDEIASLWKGGCIIRARFLENIRKAFNENPRLSNLMVDPFMTNEIKSTHQALRRIVALGAERGVPTISFSASLSYLDSYRAADLPQNLTQAQRDFFGSHTYERTDRAGTFHTEWEG